LPNSDNELVVDALAGNTAAFDELVARHQERVFALAYHALGNAEDAADIQQEAFVRVWTKLRQFRGQAAFTTWLHRIVVNACISRKRRKDWIHRQDGSIDDERTAFDSSPADCQESIVNALVVREILASIPASHRILLVLREVEGMSMAEIAEATESSVEAVTKQLWRVRKLFRERLRERFEEDGQ
jgi:RNA polymerase sigma-70 factor, ECF subfamily